MILNLQNNFGKAVDASKTAKVAMKRGTFIKTNAGQWDIATTLATTEGVLVRDVNAKDIDVAMGLPVSDFSTIQDTVLLGEYAGLEVIQKGERHATTEFDATLTDVQVADGQYLTITNGKLATSATATTVVALGWVYVGAQKLLGFKFV